MNALRNNLGMVTILVVLLVQICSGILCSNDTRTGDPQCTGLCPNVQKCYLAASSLYCSVSIHSYYMVEVTDGSSWLGQCWKDDSPRNYSAALRLDSGDINGSLFGNGSDFHAIVDSECQICFNESCKGNTEYCGLMEIVLPPGCDFDSLCTCTLTPAREELRIQVEGQFLAAEEVTVCYGQNHKLASANFKDSRLIPSDSEIGWEGSSKLITKMKKRQMGSMKVSFLEQPKENFKFSHRDNDLFKIVFGLTIDPVKSFKRYFMGVEDTSAVRVEWKQPFIEMFTLSPKWTYLELRKTGMHDRLICQESDEVFKLDESWLKTTEDISWSAYINMSLITYGNFATKSTTTCKMTNCVLCQDYVDFFMCAPPEHKAWMIAVPILAALVFILLIVVLYFVISRSIDAKTAINVNMNPAKVMAVILMFGRLGALACDVSLSVTSANYDCTVIGDVKNCVLNENMLVVIPAPMTEFCYDLINSQTNTVDGRIIIQYLEMISTASLSLDYYTSSFDVRTESRKTCAGHQFCTTGDDCNTNRTGMDYVTQGGALSSVATQLPGRSGCIGSCGCAACRCFVCDESCIDFIWGILPTGDVARIYTVTSVTNKPTVRVCFIGTVGNPTCYHTAIDRGTPIVFNQNFGSIQYLGSLEGSITEFGTNKLIMSSNGDVAAIGPTSIRTVPVKSSIGDIQSSTETGLTRPVRGSFNFDSEIGKATDSGEDSAIFTFSRPGYSIFELLPKLPMVYGTVFWHADGNSGMQGVNSNPGPLQMYVRVTNHTFVSKTDDVSPMLVDKGIIGAYQADSGALWTVSASSKSKSGVCYLSLDDKTIVLLTSSFYLTEDPQDQYINMTIFEKEGDLTVTCTSGLKSSSITAHYKLVPPEIIVGPNGTDPIIIPGIPNNSNNPLNFSLGQWLGFGFGIGGSIFLIVILVLIIGCFLKGSISWTSVNNYIPFGKDDKEIPLREREANEHIDLSVSDSDGETY